MKTTERFDKAVMKLYNAFHEGTLDAMNCSACAVGNICDNDSAWDDIGIFYSNLHPNGSFISRATEKELESGLEAISKTGYSPLELQQVEMLFISACDFTKGSKEQQFKGLFAVVEYLCELDNIPNVMDYTKLFETENNHPKYELI